MHYVYTGIIISALLLVLVVAMVPILIRSVYNLTNDTQSYAFILASKIKVATIILNLL